MRLRASSNGTRAPRSSEANPSSTAWRNSNSQMASRADNYKILANDSMVNDRHLRGTLDWTPFTVTCAVPKTAKRLDLGFCFWGGGKVWIDMESVKFDIVK